MDTVFLVGRILFAGYFVMMGLMHFMKFNMMVSYATSKNLLAPALANTIGGLALLLGGLGVLLGVYVTQALWILIIFLIVVSFIFHRFWKIVEPNQKMTEMQNFLKNLALAGAAVMMLYIPLPWVMSLTI